MSHSDSRLNFYVAQVSSRVYDLFNLNTDNKILSSVTSEELRDFLVLNDPNHPFLFFNQETDDLLACFKHESPLTDRLMSRIETTADYNFYDPTFYETNYTYNTSDDYLTTPYGEQLSFSFASKNESKNQEEISVEKYNVLPFIPDDKIDSEE